jgi:hypothetical protein
MRKSLAATLTLGGLLSAFTLDTVQACWWDCADRRRLPRIRVWSGLWIRTVRLRVCTEVLY